MLEITTTLLRNSSVFLAGEIVECIIIIKNPSTAEHKLSQTHSNSIENLAWASAQIQCYCTTDKLLMNSNHGANNGVVVNSGTSLETQQSDKDSVVVSTKPKILFCDLTLAPGESAKYRYTETIPMDSPPSYRGSLIKYSFKIIVGTQRVGSQIKLVRIPIRVLPLSSINTPSDGLGLCNDTSEELTRTNPFLETKKTDSPLEIAMENLQNITARRSPNFYMITNNHGHVCRFCLFKPAYKLGEDIVGTFDFSISAVRCMQVSVSLQCEEILSHYKKETPQYKGKIISFSRHNEVCIGLSHTQLILPVPLHATPGFETSLVTLKWRLHFEFVTSLSSHLKHPDQETIDWRAPDNVPIETMIWDLPVMIHSTNPALIGNPSNNNVHIIMK